ncbi:hypothetical protein KSS87_021633, partial [Heliosperma pusillum]
RARPAVPTSGRATRARAVSCLGTRLSPFVTPWPATRAGPDFAPGSCRAGPDSCRTRAAYRVIGPCANSNQYYLSRMFTFIQC